MRTRERATTLAGAVGGLLGLIILAGCGDTPTQNAPEGLGPQLGNATSSGSYFPATLPAAVRFCVDDGEATLASGEARFKADQHLDKSGKLHFNGKLWSTNVVYRSAAETYNFKWNEKLNYTFEFTEGFSVTQTINTSVTRKSDGKVISAHTVLHFRDGDEAPGIDEAEIIFDAPPITCG